MYRPQEGVVVSHRPQENIEFNKMKKNLKKLTIIILAIILLVAGYFLFLQKPETAAADWFDDSWLYRVGLTINNSGAADSDKKIKFDIDTAALIAAGKMQADCGEWK